MQAPVPTRLLVMADYTAHPLWDRSAGGLGDVDPAELGLSGDLQRRLREWADRFENLASTGFAWPSDRAELDFRVDGLRLAADVQQELGLGVEVLYGPQADRSPHTGGSEPRPDGRYTWQVESPRSDD